MGYGVRYGHRNSFRQNGRCGRYAIMRVQQMDLSGAVFHAESNGPIPESLTAIVQELRLSIFHKQKFANSKKLRETGAVFAIIVGFE